MPTYDTPGVYIEEQTGPGVIAGVGTSTAAFIGPARQGPVAEARRISSYDEFLAAYATLQPDGSFQPHITTPRRFYLAHAVQGYFQNGGRQAYIVRVGTGSSAGWAVPNRDGQPAFRLQAVPEGTAGNGITIAVEEAQATGPAGRAAVVATATVSAVSGTTVTVDNAAPFRVGDWVTEDQTSRARIEGIVAATNEIQLSTPLARLAAADTLRIAHLIPAQRTMRLAATGGLFPGSVVLIRGRNAGDTADVENFAIVEAVDAAGFVTLAPAPARTETFNLAVAAAPVLISQEFRLLVTRNAATTPFDNLSLEPVHPGYVFSALASPDVRALPPLVPPTTAAFPGRLVATSAGLTRVDGVDDNPGALTSAGFQAGLDVLRHVDDVNLVCIPDAAAHAERITIQQAMIGHCLAPGLKDRFAILDSAHGAPPSGPGSVEQHRQSVESPNGFAALYYPWLTVRDPFSTRTPPDTVHIPPSGHLAGVYARTDNERGVHKAPANTDVRGVLGLERILSDGQQGPLNLLGVNALRIFPGSNTAMVWGARTTVDPDVTDWLYVPVRRLLLFLEESIEEGIRWAVFEPNNLSLWQQLKRTIGEFLSRVWRDGALFGDSPEQAYYVRIDEALNPPSVRALGRLYIEIGVAAVRPAEFIIVRIGLWDGGSQVTEG